MISGKRFVIIFLIVSIVGCSSLPMVNIYIDRYGIFNQGKTKIPPKRINKAYLNTLKAIKHKNDYNALVFGSSRANHIPIRTLNSLTGDRWYKLNYSAGHTVQHLSHLRALLNNSIKLKHVILALDDLNLITMPSFYMNDYKRRPYPGSIISWLKFYKFYLFKRIDKKDKALLKNHLGLKKIRQKEKRKKKKNSNGSIDILTLKPWVQDKIADGIKYKDKIDTMHGWANDQYKNIGNVLSDIKKIKRLCQQHKIKLIIVYTPRHYKTALDRNIDEIENFKTQLAQITSFYDFSGFSKYTLNNEYWYEVSHFKNAVGNKMIEKIFDPGYKDNEFGVYITKNNVEDQLCKIRKSYYHHIKNLLHYDKEIFLSNQFLHPQVYYKKPKPTIIGISNDHVWKFPKFKFPLNEDAIVKVEAVCPDDESFCYVENASINTKNYYTKKLAKGKNVFFFSLSGSKTLDPLSLRFSPSNGDFILNNIEIKKQLKTCGALIGSVNDKTLSQKTFN